MMNNLYYRLDENNNPVLGKMEDITLNTHSRVGLDILRGLRVSTVFLVFNHECDPNSLPILFETMVFNEDCTDEKLIKEFVDYQWRYHTWHEALQGHNEIVKSIQEFV